MMLKSSHRRAIFKQGMLAKKLRRQGNGAQGQKVFYMNDETLIAEEMLSKKDIFQEIDIW